MFKREYILFFLISLLGLIPFVPELGTIDIIAPSYLYLISFQILILVFFISHNEIRINLNKIDISYLLFILISSISIVKSNNINESIIELTQYLTLFITYFNLKILFRLTPFKGRYLAIIFLLLQSVEISAVLKTFLINFNFDNGLERIRSLQGLSPNLNIGAFSILIKTPILIWIFSKTSYRLVKIYTLIILLLSMFCVLIMGSRGAIIGLVLVLIGLVILEFTHKYEGFRFFRSLTYFGLLSLAVLIQSVLYSNNLSMTSINRVSNLVDRSSLDRIEYYKTSLQMFLDDPILGIGIGNWKIESLKHLGVNIFEYTVPYHAHNDILQIASETGIFGLFSFLTLLLYPLYDYFKKSKKTKNSLDKILPFIIISTLIYFWDSNLNFPRNRPYSQMNFIYILSYYSSSLLTDNKFDLKLKTVSTFAFFLIVPITFLNAKFLFSLREGYFLHADFNTNSTKLSLPLDIVKEYQDSYPNITITAIPIKLAKANYFLQNGKENEAIDLAREGQKINPYLGFGDYIISKAYYSKGLKDSSMYYIKKSYDKVPLNSAHVVLYQNLLTNNKKYDTLRKVFEKSKIIGRPEIWLNHFYGIISDKKSLKNGFSNQDITNIKEALKLFPNNSIFKSFDLIISGGKKALSAAIKFDILAKSEYDKNNYDSAIKLWEVASSIVPKEDSYYLNIALSYLKKNEFKKSLETLKLVEQKKIKSNDGLFEFIAGFAYSSLKNQKLACQYLRSSSIKGNTQSKEILKLINCQTK